MNETNDLARLLRAAATDMPDNPFRAEEVRTRAGLHRRRQRRTVLVAGLAAVAAGAVAVVFGLGLGDDTGPTTIVPAKTSTATPPSAPPTTTPPAPPPRDGRVHLFGGVSLIPPKGWTVSASGDSGDMQVCLVPPVSQYAGLPCDGGIELQSGSVVGQEGAPFQAHQPWGWYQGSGQAPCPTPPADGTNGAVNEIWPGAAPTSGDPESPGGPSLVEQGAWTVNGYTGAYDKWAAHCDNGFTFYPRSWYLPDVPFQVLDPIGHPDADAQLLATIKVGSDESRRMFFDGGVSLIPPKGWTVLWAVLRLPGGTLAPHGRWACLVPGTAFADRSDASCSGILIEVGTVTGRAGQPFQAHQDDGWSADAGPVGCPRRPPNANSDGSDPVVSGAPGDTRTDVRAPIQQGPRTLAGQTATYDMWVAHCADDGYTFYPRSWYLPRIPFRVLDYGGNPTVTDALLASIKIS
ncbi:hypothetical protein [Pseudofrankia inefficax]|uniref:Uncharacterized protein n=1 Tax=Pseudofrankia inefficax (strain DSM 45817 / CECT 9037 / DDB 130130 / EuI1c) TaxID=298654 RepID=E3J1S8_PSEI1|nr:hypothetical protein [Pseudofrankia inefficax]ADP82886.1 hypothetical protein FraEuI1c_4896 [Pseudofrankia inefficax]